LINRSAVQVEPPLVPKAEVACAALVERRGQRSSVGDLLRAHARAYTLKVAQCTAGQRDQIMAKRKKRAKVQPKKRAKPRRRRAAVRGKARKLSKSARVKATKPTVAGAKPKRAATKKAVQEKEQRKKPPRPAVETVVVDVIEEPAPGVITVTEIEETHIPAGRDQSEEC
jgi:hypothetical protein